MRIKLKIGRSGDRISYRAGAVIEVSAAEAQRLIDAGKASPVDGAESKPEPPQIETAALEPPKRPTVSRRSQTRVTRKKAAY